MTRLRWLLFLPLLLPGSSWAEGLFEGRLSLAVGQGNYQVEVLQDRYQLVDVPGLAIESLPPFEFAFVSDGERLIPVHQGPIISQHPLWEYVLGAGRVAVSDKATGGLELSLPVSLQQRNQNCIHNGVLKVSVDRSGQGAAEFRIASETCIDLKLNFSASMAATYRQQAVAAREGVIARDRRNLAARMPVRPIADLAQRGVDIDGFTTAGVIPVEDITVYGLLMDGVHYRGGCETRTGPYPFCDELLVPSYSLAKSFFAGLGLMRLEKLYPGAADARIADYVPECAATGKWQDVRFRDALSMVTGLYDSPDYEVDEDATALEQGFFIKETHADKIAFACDGYPKRESAGKRWVYNTATTYVLGVAMNNFLSAQNGGADVYRDMLLPWWQPLSLSAPSEMVRRTYDKTAQAFTGFGITWLADDLVRLADYVNGAAILDELNADLLNSALQRHPNQSGYPAGPYRYQQGFWAKDVSELLACEENTWVPFLSGYGGLNVALLPNNTIYYYLSDAGLYSLNAGLKQIHKLKPVC